ncbi:MAG: sigma 54-interacting transcriptional regulator [Pseudomonadota bacterium]
MVALFPPAKSQKPIAKAIHVFAETSAAKWVPINKSFTTLMTIMLRAATERLAVAHIAIILKCTNHQGNRHLILTTDETELQVSSLGVLEEFIISTQTMNVGAELEGLTESVTVPMNYEQQRLGYIVASLHKTATRCDEIQPVDVSLDERKIVDDLALLASDIIAIIRRYETRYRAVFIYGDECYWIGNSLVLRQLEQRIEQLTHALHPVLIRGNKGTGKNITARTLHCLRHADILPFIESACDQWQEGSVNSTLQALYVYAKGGTLFLRNVDKLSNANFSVLEAFWASKSSELADKGAQEAVGLILSVSKYDFVTAPAITAWLKMSCIELRLPNLSERREDIRDLIRFYIHEFTLSVEFDFSEEAWLMLELYAWEGNVEQLKSVIKNVALQVETSLVTAEMLKLILNRL